MTNSSIQEVETETTKVESPLSEAFIACLETEATVLQQAIESGTTPMQAQAKTLLWLDTLVKMHAVGLDQSLKEENARLLRYKMPRGWDYESGDDLERYLQASPPVIVSKKYHLPRDGRICR